MTRFRNSPPLIQSIALEKVWVARLHISWRTATKLRAIHAFEPDDVRQAIECVVGIRGKWVVDDARGRRLMVKSLVAGRPALIILYRASWAHDEWNLGSAYEIT